MPQESDSRPDPAPDPASDAHRSTDAAPTVVNLSGYRFVTLEHLPVLQADLADALRATGVLGTVLLAEEGINVALAGTATETDAARAALDRFAPFAGLWLKRSLSRARPFSRLKVRVRREIIAFDGGVQRPPAPAVAPETLARWLDESRELTLLDTRNDYEIDAGGFDGAERLGIGHFRDFPAAVERALEDGRLALDRPVVSFCTGGIRCEKAAPWLLERGFTEVHQIEGGILNWFEQQGDAHWQGDCFVFDDRVSVTPELAETGAHLCRDCHRAVAAGTRCDCTADQPSRIADETV